MANSKLDFKYLCLKGVNHRSRKFPQDFSLTISVCKLIYLFLTYLFLVGLGLNSGFCASKAGALPLQSHFQSILLWLFYKWSLVNFFLWAGPKPCSFLSQLLK
jgi:hypothetical protein